MLVLSTWIQMCFVTFNASAHDGWIHCRSGSIRTVSNLFWNKSRQQSIILMIRCGGLANFLTVAISPAVTVCKNVRVHLVKHHKQSTVNIQICSSHTNLTLSAASASSKAGLAASSFPSAIAFSLPIPSTIFWALSFTTCTSFFTMVAASAMTVTSATTYVITTEHVLHNK